MVWLEGKAALVTGGGSGLGRAIAARFIEEGASVSVLDRSAERNRELSSQFGGKIVTITGDVTSFEDNQRAVAETVVRFGRLDCFVGNAGIRDYSLPLVRIPARSWVRHSTSYLASTSRVTCSGRRRRFPNCSRRVAI
jgi:NAD(P)-dependent dehydrogenase (short-subunit alcohol dehydrogenase family)